MLKFVRCMRPRGVANWPDPTLDQGRAIFDPQAVGIDPNSPQISTKMHGCEHVSPQSLGRPPGNVGRTAGPPACAARYVDAMTDREPDVQDVLLALAALSLRGQRSASLDDVAQELQMPAPYAELLQRLLQEAERDELVRTVVHDDTGEPRFTLTEDDERHNAG